MYNALCLSQELSFSQNQENNNKTVHARGFITEESGRNSHKYMKRKTIDSFFFSFLVTLLSLLSNKERKNTTRTPCKGL